MPQRKDVTSEWVIVKAEGEGDTDARESSRYRVTLDEASEPPRDNGGAELPESDRLGVIAGGPA